MRRQKFLALLDLIGCGRINRARRRCLVTLVTAMALGLPTIAPAQQIEAQIGGEKAAVTLVHGGVRHATIPESLWGSWAPGADLCKNVDGSVVVLSATTYVTSEENCTVYWVAETAGPDGPFYSAHIQCAKRAGNAQTTISDVVILPRNANNILLGAGFDSLKIYQRCSGNEPAPTQ